MRSQLRVSPVIGLCDVTRVLRSVACVVATLAIALPFAVPGLAAEPPTHPHSLEHRELIVDTTLTLSAVTQLAVEAYPALVELRARGVEADAWRARGGSLIAGRPSLSFRYQSDELGDRFGLQEIESGIQLPLWNWGQRRSVRELADRLDRAGEDMQRAMHWEVSGHLRRLIWQIDAADGEYELAAESLAIAERLAASIRRRYELGDVALSDVLLADSSSLAQQSALVDADAERVDAERLYQSLTALDRRPAAVPEQQSAITEIPATHPLMSFLAAEVARRKAAQGVIRQSATVAPTLLIGPRRERSTSEQAFEDSIGVTVTVPFGGAKHVNTLAAAAQREVAAAESARRQALRDLDFALHEASHGLEVANTNLGDANRRVDLAGRGLAMAELAFENGETGLLELLNLQGMFLDARRRQLRLSNAVNREVAMYNQAVGDLP